MTQEEKELLLKDLCARLPYGVIYCREYWDYERDQEMCAVGKLKSIDIKDGYINDTKVYTVWDIKPYLRPMSTMSSKERRELRQWGSLCMTEKDVVEDVGIYGAIHSIPAIDWLNAHHFDYRGLIGKGLAIEAPEDLYKNY